MTIPLRKIWLVPIGIDVNDLYADRGGTLAEPPLLGTWFLGVDSRMALGARGGSVDRSESPRLAGLVF